MTLNSSDNPLHADKNRLLFVGAAHVDDVAVSASALIPRASNPVVWQRYLGGVASNSARAAARTAMSGTQVTFSAAVGDDAAGRQVEATLKKCAIDPHLIFLSGAPTGRYSAIMDADGELHIGLSDVATAECLTLDALQLVVDLTGADAVMLDTNLSQICLAQLAATCSERKIPLAAMSVSPAKAVRLLPFAKAVTLLFCNRREALALCPPLSLDSTIDALADGLLGQGFSRFVLTDGHSPLVVQDDNERHTVPVPDVQHTHHVNGAGDALAGATFAAWTEGLSLLDATRERGLIDAAQSVAGHRPAPAIEER